MACRLEAGQYCKTELATSFLLLHRIPEKIYRQKRYGSLESRLKIPADTGSPPLNECKRL